MEKKRITLISIIGIHLFILVDAIYFMLSPVDYFPGDNPGKLFGTQMYEKFSLFFQVTNGANFTLIFGWGVFLFWSVQGLILGVLNGSVNQYVRSHPEFLGLLVLPPLIWVSILREELFFATNFLPGVFLLFMGIICSYLITQSVVFVLTSDWFEPTFTPYSNKYLLMTALIIFQIIAMGVLLAINLIGVNH